MSPRPVANVALCSGTLCLVLGFSPPLTQLHRWPTKQHRWVNTNKSRGFIKNSQSNLRTNQSMVDCICYDNTVVLYTQYKARYASNTPGKAIDHLWQHCSIWWSVARPAYSGTDIRAYVLYSWLFVWSLDKKYHEYIPESKTWLAWIIILFVIDKGCERPIWYLYAPKLFQHQYNQCMVRGKH